MIDFDERLRRLAAEEGDGLPEGYDELIKNTLAALPEKGAQSKRLIRLRRLRHAAISAAAVIAIFIALPNVSPGVARAMEKLPVLGRVVQVVTFRSYGYEDEHNVASVDTPKIQDDTMPGAQDINREISAYTDELIARFESEISDMGYHGLDVSWEVVTDSDEWFTLKLTAVETLASGYELSTYYHIDKETGDDVTLADIFAEGADYVTTISENIISQMRSRMEADEGMIYWIDDPDVPEWNFKAIAQNQNFYLSESGNIVIVFNEYDVAPGYMGSQEFEIPAEAVSGLLK